MTNLVILTGRIARDPETRETKGGTSVTGITWARPRSTSIERQSPRQQGRWHAPSAPYSLLEWHHAAAWRIEPARDANGSGGRETLAFLRAAKHSIGYAERPRISPLCDAIDASASSHIGDGYLVPNREQTGETGARWLPQTLISSSARMPLSAHKPAGIREKFSGPIAPVCGLNNRSWEPG